MGRLCYGVQAEKASVETFEERDGAGRSKYCGYPGAESVAQIGAKELLVN